MAEATHLVTAVPADDLAIVVLGLIQAEIVSATKGATQLYSHGRLEWWDTGVGICEGQLKRLVLRCRGRADRGSTRPAGSGGSGRWSPDQVRADEDGGLTRKGFCNGGP